jgi:pimeloyl-ACP methyl ester carboxylesterase
VNIDPASLVTSWKTITDPQLAANGPFLDARVQKDQKGIKFNVRIITRGGEHDLLPLEEKLAIFLNEYGFNANLEQGVSVSNFTKSYFDDTDIIIIFPLSDDIEAFCVELAKDHASRMIVCIPNGNDGKIYCRLIREKYCVETVTLLAHDSAQGKYCRCGIDIAKHCANYLMKKVSESIRQLRVQNTVVILIHGIRTRALWQGEVRQALEKTGLVAIPTNYKKLDVIRFLLPFRWTKETSVRRVENDVRSARKRFPEADLAVLAHSFGTFITGRLLLNQEHKFGRIALCGSILPIDFDFASAESRYSEIVNEVGSRDIWPAVAAKIGWGYGPTGSFGFNRAFVRDRRHASFGHSSFLNADFCNTFWVPYFCDGSLENAGDTGASPSLGVRIVDNIPLVRWVLWGLPAALLVAVAYNFLFSR